uniref:Glycerophosphoryl diester phosphodiesterase n=1 Tax=Eubacterium cellulosolvens (strain ATCC 43171 / JCM 9499 / 6) TaxID=633697 RepID=I5AVP6_EUBC6
MRKIRRNFRIFLFNLAALAGFEFLFKVLTTVVLFPAFIRGMNAMIRFFGYSYLTAENIRGFFRTPAVILLMLVALLCVAAVTTVDICAVIYILDQAGKGSRVTVLRALRFAISKLLSFFKAENLRILPVVLLFLPFLYFGVVSSFLSTIRVPGILTKYVESDPVHILVILLGYLFFSFFMMHWIYVFHFLCLRDTNYRKAMKYAKKLGKRHKVSDYGKLLGLQLLLYLVFLALVMLGSVLIILVRRSFWSIARITLPGSTNMILVYYYRLVLRVMAAISIPVGFSGVSVLFYEHLPVPETKGTEVTERKGFRWNEVNQEQTGVKGRIPKDLARTMVFLLTAVLFVVYNLRLVHGQYNVSADDIHVLEVSAHRGASALYPENTMAAFEGAVEQGADWIELDIQQSRDGQIFVMHDSSFRRTCGVNAYSWQKDYDEISRMDAGSWFDKKFSDQHPPLLSEVIALARLANIRLNIELKPNGHETDFEEGVLDVVKDAHFEKYCVITSQRYQVLERIKELDPEIRTVYVMHLAYGNIERLSAADDFSIEEAFASARLIRRMHSRGHKVYVWTVNNRRSIQTVIQNQGDNIITNNVPLAKDCVNSISLTDSMFRLVVSVEDLLY